MHIRGGVIKLLWNNMVLSAVVDAYLRGVSNLNGYVGVREAWCLRRLPGKRSNGIMYVKVLETLEQWLPIFQTHGPPVVTDHWLATAALEYVYNVRYYWIIWEHIYATLERERAQLFWEFKGDWMLKKLKGSIQSSCIRQQIRDQWINVGWRG